MGLVRGCEKIYRLHGLAEIHVDEGEEHLGGDIKSPAGDWNVFRFAHFGQALALEVEAG
jgi:hypothetical protein